MTLSPRTIQSLATTLAPEVISYILEDERYFDFMLELVPDAVESKLGQIDDDLRHELCMCIAENITLKSF